MNAHKYPPLPPDSYNPSASRGYIDNGVRTRLDIEQSRLLDRGSLDGIMDAHTFPTDNLATSREDPPLPPDFIKYGHWFIKRMFAHAADALESGAYPLNLQCALCEGQEGGGREGEEMMG